MTEVVVSDEFRSWYEPLEEREQEAVFRVVTLLQERGVKLGFPYSSAVSGSRHPLRELRVQAGGRPFRVFYCFDPDRQAVLLIGGDKTGKDRFYEDFIPWAEAIWEGYLRGRNAGKG